MIAHLKGTLLSKSTDVIIIDNNGIGYEVFVPLSTFYSLPDEENSEVSLHIYSHVREDAFILFGFNTILEKKIFRLLISVSGIGPKLAVNILSGIGPDSLLEAIARGDVVRLQSIPGIGKKTAERISLELKDKAQKTSSDINLPPVKVHSLEEKEVHDDALSALLNLGYSSRAAGRAVDKVISGLTDITLEKVITEALKVLA
ncbi:Holliday junction branch migration protein RuvA [Thermodesulfobacteriota bacterium]